MSPASRQIIVISAIIVLAAGLFAGLMLGITGILVPQLEANRRATCEALIVQLRKNMTTYQQDNGAFPPGPGPFPGMKSPVLDPWGQPFVFRLVRTIQSRVGTTPKVITWNEYRIHSIGPNGTDEGGSGDDITGGS